MSKSLCRVKTKKTKFSQAFTLLELVVVIGLLAVAFGVTSDILISLVRSQSKTQTFVSLEQQANFVSLKIEKDLRNAVDVALNGSTLQITKKNATNPVEYRLNGNVVERRDNNVDWYALTDNVSPGAVAVSCIPSKPCFSVSAGDPKVTTISIRFSALTSNNIVVNTGNIDINDTIVVRSTY